MRIIKYELKILRKKHFHLFTAYIVFINPKASETILSHENHLKFLIEIMFTLELLA